MWLPSPIKADQSCHSTFKAAPMTEALRMGIAIRWRQKVYASLDKCQLWHTKLIPDSTPPLAYNALIIHISQEQFLERFAFCACAFCAESNRRSPYRRRAHRPI